LPWKFSKDEDCKGVSQIIENSIGIYPKKMTMKQWRRPYGVDIFFIYKDPTG
jgi:hypothetical protein